MAVTKLWFIRHGEVEAHLVGTFLGVTDGGLSDLGRHQGQAVAAFLQDAGVDAVVSSPLQRARDTVAPLAGELGLAVETRPGFREMDFGAWETLSWEAIEARDADFARRWREDPATMACPGGETTDAFAAMVARELEALLEEFAGRTVALGAHAGVNRAILAHILGRPYLEMFRFAQDYGCVNAAAWGVQDWTQVALTNLVPGPQSEHPSW